MTFPSLKPLHPAVKNRPPAYVSKAKPNGTWSVPVSIQPVPPKTKRWNHGSFPHQITKCRPPDFQCAASTRQPPIGAAPPAAASSLAPRRPRNPPSHRTTPSRRLFSCDSRYGKAWSRKRWVALPEPPWPASKPVATFSSHSLTSSFGYELYEARAETACSQPCCLVHRGKRFVKIFEHDFGRILVCHTCPDFP